MPPFILTVLKIVFLALLYFFIWRAIRSVTQDVRATSGQPARRSEAPPRQQSRARPPRTVAITDDRGNTSTMQLDGQLQIGRADACQIKLTDTYVSQFHARIYRRDGAWYVEDLGSTNGTYLNQRRITGPSELRAGDKVKVGKTTLELRR